MEYKFLANGILVTVTAVAVLWYHKEDDYFPADGALGRRVLITGASTGLGEQLAYHYAKHGASVFITARRGHVLQQVVDKCAEIGHKDAVFGYYAADMMDYKTQSKLFVEAGHKKLSGIDTIIVNHAYQGQLLVWLGSEKDLSVFDNSIDVNLKSYVYTVSHALPYIKQSKAGGRIGVIGSMTGKNEMQLFSSYVTAKFGLDGFFSTLRLELQEANSPVTLTHHVLGSIATAMITEWAPKEIARLNISTLTSDVNFKPIIATAKETAYQVMKATETGERELYYPSWFKTKYVTTPSWLYSVLRHICPDLTLVITLPSQFYDNYVKYNT